MKNTLHFLLLATGLEIALLFTSTNSVLAQIVSNNTTAPRFYCGQVKDPSNNTNTPTTLLGNSTDKQPIAIVVWKNEYLSGEYSSQKRCEIISPRLQMAFNANRTYLRYGVDRQTGQGLICATSKEDKICDRTNMIFTVKSYSNAHQIIENLISIVYPGSEPICTLGIIRDDSFNLRVLMK